VISLAPLDACEVVRMVGEIASRHALSKDVIAGVSERSGGVPLFVEEVTRLLLERGEQGGVQAIPPTLQQSLAARLDRLGPARKSRRSARCRGSRQMLDPHLQGSCLVFVGPEDPNVRNQEIRCYFARGHRRCPAWSFPSGRSMLG
jgi:hypothetical protein